MKNKFLTKLQENFNDVSLLKTALTHRSWVNEHSGVRDHNERLEFLGDAVLELIVSTRLYVEFPKEKEGFMTNLRANIVNTVNLAKIATKLDIGSELFLSKGEEDGGGRQNPSLLANSVEALIGAIYLDQGLTAASKFINDHLLIEIDEKLSQPLKDAKSRLQELIQAKSLPTPKYKVIEEVGPDHNKEFTIQVLVDGKPIANGVGKSKAEGQQKAAENALNALLVTRANLS
ncbi:MAG: ribonuclease III [Patescibacteria group bacterium]